MSTTSKRARGIETPKAPQNQPRGPRPEPEERPAPSAYQIARRRLRPFRRAFPGAYLNPMLVAEVARRIGQDRIDAGIYARQEQARLRAARAAA